MGNQPNGDVKRYIAPKKFEHSPEINRKRKVENCKSFAGARPDGPSSFYKRRTLLLRGQIHRDSQRRQTLSLPWSRRQPCSDSDLSLLPPLPLSPALLLLHLIIIIPLTLSTAGALSLIPLMAGASWQGRCLQWRALREPLIFSSGSSLRTSLIPTLTCSPTSLIPRSRPWWVAAPAFLLFWSILFGFHAVSDQIRVFSCLFGFA